MENKIKILITGVCGFIGSRFANWVLDTQQGDVLVIGIDNLSGGFIENIEGLPIIFHNGDIRDSEFLEAVFKHHKKIDYVYHFAAFASEGRSNHIRSFIHHNNTVGTCNVINACVNNDAHLIFTSSVAVYSGTPPFNEKTEPCPIDEYGLSKYMSERSIEIAGLQQGLRWTIVRPRNVFGAGQNLFDPSRNLFGIMCYRALNELPIEIYGDGTNSRAFTPISDILKPLWNCRKYDKQIFNLGSSRVHTIKDIVMAFCATSGYNGSNIKYVDERHEVRHAYCDTKKSEDFLGYNSVNEFNNLLFEMDQMWQWAKKQPMRPLMDPPPLETTKNAHSSLL